MQNHQKKEKLIHNFEEYLFSACFSCMHEKLNQVIINWKKKGALAHLFHRRKVLEPGIVLPTLHLVKKSVLWARIPHHLSS